MHGSSEYCRATDRTELSNDSGGGDRKDDGWSDRPMGDGVRGWCFRVERGVFDGQDPRAERVGEAQGREHPDQKAGDGCRVL